jgi:hypothetical protein
MIALLCFVIAVLAAPALPETKMSIAIGGLQ